MTEQRFYTGVTRYFEQAAAFTSHPKGLLDQVQRCNSVYDSISQSATLTVISKFYVPGEPNIANTDSQ